MYELLLTSCHVSHFQRPSSADCAAQGAHCHEKFVCFASILRRGLEVKVSAPAVLHLPYLPDPIFGI